MNKRKRIDSFTFTKTDIENFTKSDSNVKEWLLFALKIERKKRSGCICYVHQEVKNFVSKMDRDSYNPTLYYIAEYDNDPFAEYLRRDQDMPGQYPIPRVAS